MATYVEGASTRRGSTRAWIVVGAVILLLAAIGGGIAIGRATVDEGVPPPVAEPAETVIDEADPEIVAMIDDLHVAIGTDAERFASFFTEDGVLHQGVGPAAGWLEGRGAIAGAIQSWIDEGFRAHRVGDVAQWGNFVAHGTAGPGDVHVGAAIYELTPDGQILNMWTLS